MMALDLNEGGVGYAVEGGAASYGEGVTGCEGVAGGGEGEGLARVRIQVGLYI
jgi:hypothetical protein